MLSNPEKESSRTIAIRLEQSSWPDERIECLEGGGSGNSPVGAEKSRIEGYSMVAGLRVAERKLKMIRNKFRRIEKLLKDSFPMDSGGEGRRKEKEKI